jgi:hypothetical protein
MNLEFLVFNLLIMVKILKEGSTILCGYCERNDAYPKFLNIEVEEKRKTEIRGAYKYHTNLRLILFRKV